MIGALRLAQPGLRFVASRVANFGLPLVPIGGGAEKAMHPEFRTVLWFVARLLAGPDHPEDGGFDNEPPSRRGAVIALVFLVLLGLFGLWISRALRDTGKLQDCVMQGRTNCVPSQ
ncbi:hypothetical protein [Acidisoma sp. L85]|uniref:hypothetical protein n=2 Tax=unclassified Acidisoma TaxID=2634065 RepID=UPI001C202BC4|nr:hypothetical protein [Acidisoma sp. L85]